MIGHWVNIDYAFLSLCPDHFYMQKPSGSSMLVKLEGGVQAPAVLDFTYQAVSNYIFSYLTKART